MYPVYPNLPLLEEKFKYYLDSNGIIITKTRDGKKYSRHDIECLGVFIQNWSNTAGLFESGGFSGQAMSSYYTTVMTDYMTGCYAVFQNNDLVYVIEGESEELLKDLENHTIKPFKTAIRAYSKNSNNNGDSNE